MEEAYTVSEMLRNLNKSKEFNQLHSITVISPPSEHCVYSTAYGTLMCLCKYVCVCMFTYMCIQVKARG